MKFRCPDSIFTFVFLNLIDISDLKGSFGRHVQILFVYIERLSNAFILILCYNYNNGRSTNGQTHSTTTTHNNFTYYALFLKQLPSGISNSILHQIRFNNFIPPSLVSVNPCERSAGVCDENAECIPRGNDFMCRCRRGFTGDGRNCTRGEYTTNEVKPFHGYSRFVVRTTLDPSNVALTVQKEVISTGTYII